MFMLGCFYIRNSFFLLISIDMSIYRHIVDILLSIYRYHRYALWRINDSTSDSIFWCNMTYVCTPNYTNSSPC